MYTKTTATCDCNGKAHYPKIFGLRLFFFLFPIGLQVKIPFKLFSPALSISLYSPLTTQSNEETLQIEG